MTSRENVAERVRAITKKRGVTVVYDGVGKDTFFASLDSLAPLGLMVSYGNASGPVPPVAPLELTRRGSLFLTRPTMYHYTAKRSELERGARELFEVVGSGKVRVRIGREYRLADAAEAHRDLEARRTTGSLLLIPDAGVSIRIRCRPIHGRHGIGSVAPHRVLPGRLRPDRRLPSRR